MFIEFLLPIVFTHTVSLNSDKNSVSAVRSGSAPKVWASLLTRVLPLPEVGDHHGVQGGCTAWVWCVLGSGCVPSSSFHMAPESSRKCKSDHGMTLYYLYYSVAYVFHRAVQFRHLFGWVPWFFAHWRTIFLEQSSLQKRN